MVSAKQEHAQPQITRASAACDVPFCSETLSVMGESSASTMRFLVPLTCALLTCGSVAERAELPGAGSVNQGRAGRKRNQLYDIAEALENALTARAWAPSR